MKNKNQKMMKKLNKMMKKIFKMIRINNKKRNFGIILMNYGNQLIKKI